MKAKRKPNDTPHAHLLRRELADFTRWQDRDITRLAQALTQKHIAWDEVYDLYSSMEARLVKAMDRISSSKRNVVAELETELRAAEQALKEKERK